MADTSDMILIDRLSSSAVDDAEELMAMAGQAERFLGGHPWCRSIRRGLLDRGWAGILAVFYFEIVPEGPADGAVWMVVGDIPPAYLDLESCPDGAAALDGYVRAMQEWVDAAAEGASVDQLIPVYHVDSFRPTPPTPEQAAMLRTRLDFIRERLLPLDAENLRHLGGEAKEGTEPMA